MYSPNTPPFGNAARKGEDRLYLTEKKLREAAELMFFGYRSFTQDPDLILAERDYGRAHHRALHFVGRQPGVSVAGLLAILGVTKQSLARVLKPLMDDGLIEQRVGAVDRRQRLLYLTEAGTAFEERLSAPQRARLIRAFREAGPEVVSGFRHVLELMMDKDELAQTLSLDCRGENTMSDAPHILVVDDDSRIRGLLKKYLVRNGYAVTEARDAAHARRLLSGLAFDLLVIDVMMPGEDGFSLTKAVRETLSTPVMLLTARADAEDRIKGLERAQMIICPNPSNRANCCLGFLPSCAVRLILWSSGSALTPPRLSRWGGAAMTCRAANYGAGMTLCA